MGFYFNAKPKHFYIANDLLTIIRLLYFFTMFVIIK